MSSKIEISKIDIKIGDQKISLTPDEIKELQSILAETFPEENTVYVPGTPIVINRPVWPDYSHWTWDYPGYYGYSSNPLSHTITLSTVQNA